MKLYVCLGQKKVYGLTDKELIKYINEKGYTPNILYTLVIDDDKILEQLDKLDQNVGEQEQL